MPDNLTNQPMEARRPFQAIDGLELSALIQHEIRRAIEADAKFKRHLTYPVFSFAYNIIIRAYPMDPSEFQLKGQYRRVAPADALIPPEVLSQEPEILTVKGELNVDAPAEGGLAPDEARERAGLPVPMPAHASLGKSGTMTVDAPSSKPITPPVSSTSPDLDDPAKIVSANSPRPSAPAHPAKPPRNRAGASPNFARSVDLSTRATPEGDGVTRVDGNIQGGSS